MEARSNAVNAPEYIMRNSNHFRPSGLAPLRALLRLLGSLALYESLQRGKHQTFASIISATKFVMSTVPMIFTAACVSTLSSGTRRLALRLSRFRTCSVALICLPRLYSIFDK